MTTATNPANLTPLRRARRQRGGVLAFVLVLLMCSLLLGLSYFTLSNTISLTAFRGAKKTQANLLADAAVQAHFDFIRNTMGKNQAWDVQTCGTLAPALLWPSDGTKQNDGTYSSQATVLKQTSVKDTFNNKQVTTTTIQLKGTGTAPQSRITSEAYATFSVVQEAPLTVPKPILAFDATAAIQSNSTITLATNGGFRTHSSGNHYDGSVLANGGIIWNPQSGSKGANPNSLVFDGQVFVGGSVAALLTNSLNGLGNPSGVVNFQTFPAIAQNGHPVASANSVTDLGVARDYPGALDVAQWKSGWIHDAQQGGFYIGSVSTTALATTNGERRITAPAYIWGNLNANSNQLILQPSSDPNAPNVIYVAGNINNAAQIYNRGVVLVVAGKYTAQNSSAQYALQTQNSPYKKMDDLYAKTGLVSLSPTSDAIDMGVNAASDTGLIYAALGGIRVLASNNFNGALVAGGAGLTGGIVAGGPNSFDITFTPTALQNRADFMFTASLSLGGGQPGAINKTTVNPMGQFFWGK